METEKKKEAYEEPKAEIIMFEQEDVITTSGALVLPGDDLWNS